MVRYVTVRFLCLTIEKRFNSADVTAEHFIGRAINPRQFLIRFGHRLSKSSAFEVFDNATGVMVSVETMWNQIHCPDQLINMTIDSPQLCRYDFRCCRTIFASKSKQNVVHGPQ